MNKLNRYRFMLIASSLLGLGFVTGCPGMGTQTGKEQKEPQKKEEGPDPLEREHSLQKILDEAAKGKTANLALLEKIYREKVSTAEDANSLADMSKDGNGFICHMMGIPFKAPSKNVLVDLFGKLSDSKSHINEECKDGKHAIELALALRVGDDLADAQEIIFHLVKNGGRETIDKASDPRELGLLLDAVKAQGPADELTAVLQVASLVNAMQWLADNQGDKKVTDALKAAAVITNEMIVDQAEDALRDLPIPPAKIKAVKLLYRSHVLGDASGTKGSELAKKAPSSGQADRFLHFLMQFPADDEIFAIASDLLTQVRAKAETALAASGDAAVLTLLNEGGAGATPLNRALLYPSSPAGNKIIKTMVEKDIPAFTAALAPAASIEKLLTALREESTQADLVTAFDAAFAAPALKNLAMTWARANFDEEIVLEAGAPTVRAALATSHTMQMTVDEAAKGAAGLPPTDPAYLSFLYDLNVTDQASAQTLVGLSQTGGVAGPGVDLFLNFVAKLPGSEGTYEIFDDLFGHLAADAKDQINRPGLSGNALADIFAAAGDLDARKKIIALMVEKGDADTLATADDSPKLTLLLNAVLEKKPGILNRVVGDVDLVTHRASLFAWFSAARARPDAAQAGAAAAAADALVTFEMILEEVVKGPGLTDIALLKDMFDAKITTLVAAQSLISQTAAGALVGPLEDSFVNYLALLPVTVETAAMWQSLATVLDDDVLIKAQINRRGLSGSPIALLVDDARVAAPDDVADNFKDIIAWMVKKGGEDAVRVADDLPKLTTLMNAVLEKGSEDDLVDAVAHVELLPLHQADLIAWFKVRYADPNPLLVAKVRTVAGPKINYPAIVADAASGAAANLTWLNFMFEAKIIIQDDARDLVAHAGLVGNAAGDDIFVNYLGRLPATAATHNIWLQLDRLLNDAALFTSLINRAGATGSPIAAMLNGAMAGDEPTMRKNIIALMAVKGNADTMLAAIGAKLAVLLDAVLEMERGELANVLALIDKDVREVDLVAWLYSKRADVDLTDAALKAGISNRMIVNEAAKGPAPAAPATDLAWLKRIFDAKMDGQQAAAQALVIQPPTGGAAPRFVNYLAALPVNNADTGAIWRSLFALLAPEPDEVRDEINRGGVASPIAVLLRAPLAGEDPAQLQEIIALMVEKGDAATVQLADALGLPILLDAVLAHNPGLVLGNAIAAVDVLTHRAVLRTWFENNHQTAGLTPAMANAVIDDAMILAEAAKGPLPAVPATDPIWLKFMYDARVAGEPEARTLAAAVHGGDRLTNFLALLPVSVEVHDIWKDLFDKLAVSPADAALLLEQVNLQSTIGALRTPFNTLLRKVAVPLEDTHLTQAIAEMAQVAQANPAVVGAIAAARLPNLYEAVRLHRTQALLQTMFTQTNNAHLNAIIDWVLTAQVATPAVPNGGGTVLGAFYASVRTDHKLDEAYVLAVLTTVEGFVALMPYLRLVHEAFVDSPVSITALIAADPTVSRRLANLQADADSLIIWTNHLEHLDPAQITAELARLDGGVTVFQRLIGDRTAPAIVGVDVPDDLNSIIALMAEKASGPDIVAAVGVDHESLQKLMEAILQKGSFDSMKKVFEYVPGEAEFGRMFRFAWTTANRDRAIGGGGTVSEAMTQAAVVRITNALPSNDDPAVLRRLLLAEVQDPATLWDVVLTYVQSIVFDEPSAQAVALLADGNNKLLHNLIVSKPQTEDSVEALRYYLSFLTSGGGADNWEQIRDNNRNDGGVAQTAAQILQGLGASVATNNLIDKAFKIFVTDDALSPRASQPVL